MARQTRRNILKSVAASGAIGLAGCIGDDEPANDDPEEDDEIKAAFVYDGRVGDHGWTRSNDDARQRVEEELTYVSTSSIENVGAGEAEAVFNDFVDDDFDVIFATSVTFQDAMFTVAEENPDVAFLNANGLRSRENMSRYTFRFFESSFIAGMLAGMKTETNLLGYVGGFAVSLILRHVNSWAWGAHYVNPDAEVEARFLGTFYDPEGARSTVDSLQAEGVDAVSGTMDSIATQERAAANEMWTAGWATDMSEFGGDWFLTGSNFRWDEFFIPQIEQIRDGTWEADEYWLGFDSGVITLAPFGPQITEEEQEEVLDIRQQIVDSDFNVWDGTQFEDLSHEPGSPLEAEMNEYVENVRGDVPS